MEKGSGRGKRPCPTTPPTPTPKTEGDDLEENMEKFYALIENIKAMRDLIRTNENKRRKMEAAPPPPPPLWRPTFELEDFNVEEGEPGATAAEEGALNPSKEEERRDTKEKSEVGEEDNSVDLSLSL